MNPTAANGMRGASGAARIAVALVIAAFAAFAAACAARPIPVNGGNVPSESPFYFGASVASVRSDTGRIGHLPILYQLGTSPAARFDPTYGEGTPAGALLREMNAFLDSLDLAGATSRRLVDRGAAAVIMAMESRMTPPDVSFGCFIDALRDECADRDGPLGRRVKPVRLSVARPSGLWSEWLDELMLNAGVQHALVITLEPGEYLPRQKGIVGRKELELGTGHVIKLPWLTSDELPVTVLQFTGALMARNGRVVRFGAQGIHARRAPLVGSPRAPEPMGNRDVEAIRENRREDLPGHPLVWQAALRELVAGLTGRSALAR